MTDPILTKIRAILDEAAQMKNAYFFRPLPTAHQRRSYERQHSHDVVTWTDGGHTYSASYNVVCTCSSIRAGGTYYRDGKPTTLTAIKNSYTRMGGVI